MTIYQLFMTKLQLLANFMRNYDVHMLLAWRL